MAWPRRRKGRAGPPGATLAAASALVRTAEGVRRPAGLGDTPRVLGRARPTGRSDRATEPSAPTASPPLIAMRVTLSGGAAGPAWRYLSELP
jgi:hypothetical protein